MSAEQKSDLYFKVYSAQKGGELPAYKGSRKIQYGSGFGDILRSTYRHVLPLSAEHAAPTAPPSIPMIEETTKLNLEDENGKILKSGSGNRKRKPKKKRSSKKNSVYKGKKQRTKKRKVTDSEASSKIPNFNF